MNDLNRRLQETFLFSSADLLANRAGRLTPRQQARLRAARSGQRLAIAIFVVVMVGALAVLAAAALLSGSTSGASPGDYLPALTTIAGVIGAAILFGILSSRRYMTGPTPRQMLMAQGPARIGREKAEAARFEIKIGAAILRLVTREQRDAFQPDTEYRVFYLPGPVATLLSAEVVGTEAEAEAAGVPETPPEQDQIVQLQRRARPVLYVLAALALGIPLAGIAAAFLPGALRWLVMGVLLVVAIGFVFWALRRIGE